MRSATRAGLHVDRTACAWLIRRFIDPAAEFVFVGDPDDVPPDATPFDMRGVELSHHGDDCTFETALRRYELDDPVLWDIARIVHEADLEDERYDAPEARGLDVLLRGLSMGRWIVRSIPPHRVWICQLDHGRQVAPVERVEAATDKLDVLLRHRPRSIPQAQESA